MAIQSIVNSGAGFNQLLPENKEFYEKVLLDRLIDEVQLYKFAKKSALPKNVGSIITWRIFKSLALPAAPLVEGVTPNPVDLSIVQFQSTIAQHGSFVKLTDFVEMIAIDPVLTETSQLLGEQAAEYVDKLIRTQLYLGANVYRAGAVATDALVQSGTQTITVADLNAMVRIFKRNNVKPFAEGKYMLLITPEVEADLKNLATINASWVDIAKYGPNEMVLKGEIGSFMGFKMVIDNNLEVGTAAGETLVHKCLAFGMDAFGVVEVEGGGGRPGIIYKGLGSAGTDDPLDQTQTLGWKMPGFGVRIIHEEALINYRVYSANGVAPVAPADANRAHYDSTPQNYGAQ